MSEIVKKVIVFNYYNFKRIIEDALGIEFNIREDGIYFNGTCICSGVTIDQKNN